MEQVRQTFAEMESLAPGITKELTIIDNKKLNLFVEKLYAAASRVERLAGNADEAFRGTRAADELSSKLNAFQEEASARNVALFGEGDDLSQMLDAAVNKLTEGREKGQKSDEAQMSAQAENDEIYKMRDAVETKVLKPLTHRK